MAPCGSSLVSAAVQPLNLDQNTSSASGLGAARAMAEALEAQVKSIEKGGSLSASDEVRVALRRAAATLIRLGERQGSRGAVQVMTGETLARRMPDFDAAIAGEFATLDATTLRGVARDLSAIGPNASTAAFDSVAAMDRTLRDALAPLVQAAGPSVASRGWIVMPRTPGVGKDSAESPARASMADLARALSLSPDAVKSFADLDARLATADKWTAFAAWADEVRGLVRSSALVAGAGRPPWLSDAAFEGLRVEFVGAVAGLGGAKPEAERERAMVSLRKLAALAEFSRAADAVDATASGRSTRNTRAAMNELVASPAWLGESGIDARVGRVTELLGKVSRGAEDIPERSVIRQLRPAVIALEPAARQASLQLLETLPRVVRKSDALSDPAVLAAITLHARRVADLKLAARVSDLLAGHPEATTGKRPDEKSDLGASDPLRPLADRVLLLGQSFAKADKRESALAEFRELAAQLSDYTDVVGERELRAEIQPGVAPGDWAAVTGSREKKLVTALGEARSRWLSERSVPRTQPTARAATRLAQFRIGLGMFRDAAAIRAMSERATDEKAQGQLQSWAGWEVSREGLGALVKGLSERTTKLAEQLVIGDEKAAAKLIDELSREYASAWLVARLDRGVRAVATPASSPSVDALAQVALGPPREDAWMVGYRAELAALCRDAEELARAESRGDAAAGKTLRQTINRTALNLLAAMDARE